MIKVPWCDYMPNLQLEERLCLLYPPWTGPQKIVKLLSEFTYRIQKL